MQKDTRRGGRVDWALVVYAVFAAWFIGHFSVATQWCAFLFVAGEFFYSYSPLSYAQSVASCPRPKIDHLNVN